MPDEKRIKDFEPATNLLIDDWFAVDSPSQGTRKIQKSMFMADEIASLQTLSTAMGNAQTDIGNLQTRAGMSQNLNFGDNLTDGVNILSVLLGAEPYVNTRTYAVGEYCIYEKQLYKCTTAVTSAEDFDSDKWTLTNVKTELTELNSSLANTITAYGKGTYRLTAINNLYGYITSGGNFLYLSIPINIKPEVNSISISELLLGLRIMPGGYAGGADNFNALSYISAAGISKAQNMILIYLSKSNGWGATNNTPTIGSGTITFTLS